MRNESSKLFYTSNYFVLRVTKKCAFRWPPASPEGTVDTQEAPNVELVNREGAVSKVSTDSGLKCGQLRIP